MKNESLNKKSGIYTNFVRLSFYRTKSKSFMMNFKLAKVSIMAFAFLLVLASCANRKTVYQRKIIKGNVFGTYYSVSYYSTDGKNYKAEIDSVFNDFNKSLSYYNPNSLISKINRNETDIADKYFDAVLRRALEISEETEGAFDVTVTPLVNIWGFGFEDKRAVTRQKIDSILRFVGYEKVSLENGKIVKEDERVRFDFNAIAKGYAADVVGKFLEGSGIDIYMVEIGGDLITRGLKPDGTKWRIGIEKPAAKEDDPQEWQYLLELHDQAVATSGSYRKYFERKDGSRYSHTIDPKSGYPVAHNLLSVTVVADDAMSADAYATAFMVMGLEKAKKFVEDNSAVEAFFIFSTADNDFATYTSSGLNIVERGFLADTN